MLESRYDQPAELRKRAMNMVSCYFIINHKENIPDRTCGRVGSVNVLTMLCAPPAYSSKKNSYYTHTRAGWGRVSEIDRVPPSL